MKGFTSVCVTLQHIQVQRRIVCPESMGTAYEMIPKQTQALAGRSFWAWNCHYRRRRRLLGRKH